MPAPPDRDGVIDAILRLLEAIDDDDAALLSTALTADAVIDMSGLSAVTGSPMPVLNGLEAATAGLLTHGVGAMDTGHVASNFRIQMEGDVAKVGVMTVANHYRKGEGSIESKTGLVAGNRWKIEVVQEAGKGERRGEGVWKIRRAEIRNLWCEGDLSVFG